MKPWALVLLAVGIVACCTAADPLDLVDTRIGNAGFGWGVGGSPPAAQYPFGSMRLSPDTVLDTIWLYFLHFGGYSTHDSHVRAFSHTHMVGSGASDLGNFGIMVMDKAVNASTVVAHGYRTRFTHDDETAKPGLYEVSLPDIHVRSRLTACGTHCGMHQHLWIPVSAPATNTAVATAAGERRQVVLLDVCHTNMPDDKKDACRTAAVSIAQGENGVVIITGEMRVSGSLSGRHPKGGVLIYFYAEVSAEVQTTAAEAASSTSAKTPLAQASRAKVLSASPIAPVEFGLWKDGVLTPSQGLTPRKDASTTGSLGVYVDFGPLACAASPAELAGKDEVNGCQVAANIGAGLSWISADLAVQNFRQQSAEALASAAPAATPSKRAAASNPAAAAAASTAAWVAAAPRRLTAGDFNAHVTILQNIYRDKLASIEVSFPADDKLIKQHQTMFATSLYRQYMTPSIFSESGSVLDSNDQVYQWPYANGSVALTDMSIWDTFRSVHPIQNLIEPQIARDAVRSLMQIAIKGGDFERWPLANVYTGCMIGDHGFNVIADFALNHIAACTFQSPDRNADVRLLQQALPYMLNVDTQRKHGTRADYKGYMERGWVDVDVDTESTPVSLSYAFDDHAISVVAGLIGDNSTAAKFAARAKNYRHSWNNATQFMCPRKANGEFTCPTSDQEAIPYFLQKPHYFTEGDIWQWSWFVQHDVRGLVALFPSPQAFVDKLETFVKKSDPWFAGTTIPNPYYWMGNEPDMHTAWLFSFVGRHDLTAKYVRWSLDMLFTDQYDGVPGNSDYGALEAWAVYATLGLYPFPGTGEYALSVPLVEKATIRLPSLYTKRTKVVTITYKDADGTGKLGAYSTCAAIDGKNLPSPLLKTTDLFNAESDTAPTTSTLTFTTSNTPTKTWCGQTLDTRKI